jgi:hypothetical protein
VRALDQRDHLKTHHPGESETCTRAAATRRLPLTTHLFVVARISANVQSFTKPREPTARAAKGFPPPFMEADYPACGGQRPQAAPRKTGVMCRISNGGS